MSLGSRLRFTAGAGRWLLVGLLAALGAGCVEQEPSRPTEKDWVVIRQNLLKAAPAPKHAVNASLEGKVTYLGLDVDKDDIKPGDRVKLTHYWQVKDAVPGWRLFVHVNDPGSSRFHNADHKPIGGRYPVTMWKAGDIVRDEHAVTIPADWPSDKAIIYVGLWRGQLRMKPTGGPQDEQNRVRAATLAVKVSAKMRAKTRRKRLVAVKTAKRIKLDGRLDDAAWAKAPSSGLFVNTLTGAPAAIKTEAKVAWDDTALYFAFDNIDDDVWSALEKRDDKLWTQEAVEILLDANGDGRDYIEVQVNPNGAIFDSYLASYRKNDNAWNGKISAAVKVDGTLNKRDDKDKRWTVEIAIPWSDAKGKGSYALRLPPHVGDVWRVNLFRLDLPRSKSQVVAGWSPPLVGDFHQLARFGELAFGDEAASVPSAAPPTKTAQPTSGSAPTKARTVSPPSPKRLTAQQASGAPVVVQPKAAQ